MDFRHANYVLEGVLEDLEADRLTDALIRLQEATPEQAREYARQRAALAKPKTALKPSVGAISVAKPAPAGVDKQLDKHRTSFDKYSPKPAAGKGKWADDTEESVDRRPSWTPLPKSATKFGPRPHIEGKKKKGPTFRFQAVLKKREERIEREAWAALREGEAEDNAFKAGVAQSQANKPKPPTNKFNIGQRGATIGGKQTSIPSGTKTMTKSPNGGYTPGQK